MHTPKIDKHMKAAVKMMTKSGRWELRPGTKHAKLILKDDAGKEVDMMVAPGSSCDPVRGLKNFVCLARKKELDAGYKDTSIPK